MREKRAEEAGGHHRRGIIKRSTTRGGGEEKMKKQDIRWVFLINCLKEAMEAKYLIFIELRIIYTLSCLNLNYLISILVSAELG